MFRFENLDIWKEAEEYCVLIYKTTESFPKAEQFSLVSQLRRSAVSVASNIAEGSASATKKEFYMFLGYSIRSIAENISQLRIAMNLGYIKEKEYAELYLTAEKLIKRITAFRNSLGRK
ncbi:four helix bundle protein [Patescibacteria group bacterium]